MGATIQNKNTDELISFEEFKNLNREQITTMLDLKGVYLIVIRDSLGRPYFKVGSTGNGKSCNHVLELDLININQKLEEQLKREGIIVLHLQNEG